MGRMGSAMAARLLKLGHAVAVWNRTAAKTQPLAAAGAKVVPTPKALAEAGDLIITMLSDTHAVEATCEIEGFLKHGKLGTASYTKAETP